MSHFHSIVRVPGDPILGLMDAYRADRNPAKLDLGVGVYKDAQGLTPIPRAVKLAEQRLVESETTKSYIGGHGDPLFGSLLSQLVLGADSPLLAERAGTTQTPGGTGALRLCADFIAHCLPSCGIWLSDPTWPIHESIFAAAGLRVGHYPYVGADNQLNVEAMIAALAHVPKGDVVLLHACCHNPTGFDLSPRDWKRVLEVVKARELLPLIDFAYQGFGDGLEQDGLLFLLEEFRSVPRAHWCAYRLRRDCDEAAGRAQPAGVYRAQSVVHSAGSRRGSGRHCPG